MTVFSLLVMTIVDSESTLVH